MNFTGREDILNELEQPQQPSGDRITAVVSGDPLPRALQGLGGVGKTAVAIEYAYRNRAKYDLVWWIQADQLPLVRSSLAALAERLGLEAARASGIEAAAAQVRDALRRGEPYGRWLLIFDNADEPDQLFEIIPQGPGDVLITSRDNRWQSAVKTVPLNVFARAESVEFLIKRAPKGLSKSDADRLAEALGDLPLALEQAVAVQTETGMPVDEYLQLLEENVTQLMAEGKSVEYPTSMTAAWKLSVTALRQQLPEALELLRYCAFFGPDPIPRDAFRRGAPSAVTRVRDLTANPILLARAVRALGRFALVKIDGRSLSVHRLIQALLRDELTKQEQEEYRHEVHLILAAAAPPEPDDIAVWPRYSELVAHVASPNTKIAHSDSPGVRAFALNMVRYLYQSGDLASSQSFAEQFISQWTNDSGAEHPNVLDAQRHLANTLRQLGDYPQAFNLTEKTLEQSTRILGEQNPLTLVLRNSLGGDHRARGDFRKALALDEQTRKLHEDAFEENDPRTLRVLQNLASDYGRCCQYESAVDLFRQVFVLMSDATAKVSPTDVLTAWTGLAWVVRCSGSYVEARDVSEDASDYGRENLGSEHYRTLRSSIGLSIALRLTGNSNDEALQIAREIYDVCRRVRGDDHPDTLAAAVNLTNIQRETGQLDDALRLTRETIERYPRIFGDNHPYNFGCIGNLALILHLAGDYAEARKQNEIALAGLDRALTRDHDYSLAVAISLASDLAALGEIVEARALGEDTLSRLRRLLGPAHPITLGCASNLALDYHATGAEEKATELWDQVKYRHAAALGSKHPDTLEALAGHRYHVDFDPPFI